MKTVDQFVYSGVAMTLISAAQPAPGFLAYSQV